MIFGGAIRVLFLLTFGRGGYSLGGMGDDDSKEAAYVQLLTEHQSMIRAYIVSLLPGAPGVDDVIQEANAVLWRKRSSFGIGSDFTAWALTIAKFQVMAHWKSLKLRRWVTLDEPVLEKLAGEMEEGIDSSVEEARVDALRRCLGELREADRELILQRYWRKTRLQDFAVISGRSVDSLKVTLFRLRAGLKRCIDGKMSTICRSEA